MARTRAAQICADEITASVGSTGIGPKGPCHQTQAPVDTTSATTRSMAALQSADRHHDRGRADTGNPPRGHLTKGTGIATKQAIRRGTFTPVTARTRRIRDDIEHGNTYPQPFVWAATTDEIVAKVRWVETDVKKLVTNNWK
jgi:hypothetical protein